MAEPVLGADAIILNHADSLVGYNFPNQTYRDFYGHVSFTHGNVNVLCDHAKHYIDENKVELDGNVVITQNDLVLTSPRVDYYGNTSLARALDSVKIKDKKYTITSDYGEYNTRSKIAVFNKHVVLKSDSATVYADWVTYDKLTQYSSAKGNVVAIGKATNAILTSDSLFNDPSIHYSMATGNPILFQIDTIVKKISIKNDTLFVRDSSKNYIEKIEFDTLSIASDTMEGYRLPDNEQYIFTGNVEINKGNISAKCNLSKYFKTYEFLELRGNPVVWYDETRLLADSIIIYMKDNSLSKIDAFFNAIAVLNTDTLYPDRINQISGKHIVIETEGDKPGQLTSMANAKSVYFFTDDKGGNGLDQKTTDTVVVKFSDGEVSNIYWIGKTYAQQIPENIIFDKIKSYYLPEFRDRKDKPERKILDADINRR